MGSCWLGQANLPGSERIIHQLVWLMGIVSLEAGRQRAHGLLNALISLQSSIYTCHWSRAPSNWWPTPVTVQWLQDAQLSPVRKTENKCRRRPCRIVWSDSTHDAASPLTFSLDPVTGEDLMDYWRVREMWNEGFPQRACVTAPLGDGSCVGPAWCLTPSVNPPPPRYYIGWFPVRPSLQVLWTENKITVPVLQALIWLEVKYRKVPSLHHVSKLFIYFFCEGEISVICDEISDT